MTWESASYEPHDPGLAVRAQQTSGAKIDARNKTFAFIGSSYLPTEVLREQLFWIGGALARSVKAGVDYVVVGSYRPPTQTDRDKASKLGIPMISDTAFQAIPRLDWTKALRVARTTKTPKP